MQRSQIYFTKRQKDFFKKESLRTGISSAELMRRVLDSYIDNSVGKKKEPKK